MTPAKQEEFHDRLKKLLSEFNVTLVPRISVEEVLPATEEKTEEVAPSVTEEVK